MNPVQLVSAALVGVLGVLGVAGCSDSGGGKADKNFVATATAACQDALDSMTQPFPWEHWDEHNPQAAQLPAVATYLDGLPTSHRATGFLAKLGEPKSGTKTWRAFVALVGQQQSIVGEQITAAKASDKAAFVDTVDRLEALNPKIDAAGNKAGFTKSSACIQLFG